LRTSTAPIAKGFRQRRPDKRRSSYAGSDERHLSIARTGLILAALLFGLAIDSPAAWADAPQAATLLNAMSDYLAAQKSVSFDYQTKLDLDDRGQTITSADSGAVVLNRPDKIRATRTGEFVDVELVFDGKTISMLNKSANVYGQADDPGTIDELVDKMRDKYHRPVPGANLLSDIAHQRLPQTASAKYLGSEVINGVECSHLAVKEAETDVDWEIWIAGGDRPYPCRYATTTPGITHYTLDIRNWKAGSEAVADDFSFQPPKNAEKVDLVGILFEENAK
jgi:hypothetical protein